MIYHFSGDSKRGFELTKRYYDKFKFVDLNIPDEITILTVYNKSNETTWMKQLRFNGIQYTNAYYDLNIPWVNSLKIKYINDYIPKIKSKYTLFLDAVDVVIESFDNLLTEFNRYNTLILFNASNCNYPKIECESIIGREELGICKYLNSGVFFGYTDSILEFFKDLDYTKSSSDQEIIRKSINKYTDTYQEGSQITIDYHRNIFKIIKPKLPID